MSEFNNISINEYNENYSIGSKLLYLVDFYNDIDINEINDINKINDIDEINKNKIDNKYSLEHQLITKKISEEYFLPNNALILYKSYMSLKIIIANCLIKQILTNSPKVNITLTKFLNIKTQLFPYQINNLNWMYDIEKKTYHEEYTEIKKNIYLKVGDYLMKLVWVKPYRL